MVIANIVEYQIACLINARSADIFSVRNILSLRVMAAKEKKNQNRRRLVTRKTGQKSIVSTSRGNNGAAP
jgi:hypothetical protein